MVTNEPIDVLNKRLEDQFGRFEDGRPNWRIVASDDQYEVRLCNYTPEGLELSQPTMLRCRKYPFDRGKFILERLIPVSLTSLKDLTTKTSYEPIWTFEDKNGKPLPPIWEAIFLLIDQVLVNIANPSSTAKYKTPEGLGNTRDEIEARVKKMQEHLFGDESAITDALSLDSAVGYGVRRRRDWLK